MLEQVLCDYLRKMGLLEYLESRTGHEKYRTKDTATWMEADPIKHQRVFYSIAQNQSFIKFAQAMLHKKRYIDTDRPNTNFVKIAKAFGIKAKDVKKLDELDEILKESINSTNGVHLINVITDPEEFLPSNFY